MRKALLSQALLAALATSAAPASAQEFQFPNFLPKTVDSVELPRFLGKWYEVASTKPFFQNGCVCVTANYSLRSDGKVDVVNTCRKDTPQGEASEIRGEAETSAEPGKLTVSFGGFKSPFPNYWIVDLAPDYSYAVISSPLRNPVWILSRKPTLAPGVQEQIVDRLNRDGYFTSLISPTLQEGCNN